MMPLTLSDGLEEKEMLNSPFNKTFEVLRRIIEKMGFLETQDPFRGKTVTGFLDGIVVTRVPKKDAVMCGMFQARATYEETRTCGSKRGKEQQCPRPTRPSLVMTGCEALRKMYRQKRLPSCCGLGKTPMVNDRESSINPVSPQRRNGSETSHAGSRWCLSITTFPSVVQPGDRRYLRELYNVNNAEHGKPYEPHDLGGIPTARKGDGSEGRGTKKKQKPSCNRADRVY